MLAWIKRFLIDIYHLIFSAEYRLLRCSILFDPDYYLKKNQDVAESETNPILHYLNFGYSELRQPGPFFDPTYYISQFENFDSDKKDPLSHYLLEGYKGDYWPNPIFDPVHYLRSLPKTLNSKKNPLIHFIKTHRTAPPVSSPSPYFDPDFYCLTYPDVIQNQHNPYLHYLKTGIEKRRQPSIWFNAPYYSDKYNLETRRLITHYLLVGSGQNNSPSPLFDPIFYAETYNISTKIDLFADYIEQGVMQNRKPCSWFDPVFYQQRYLKHANSEQAPLFHFLSSGMKKGLYPNQEIDDFAIKPTISILVPVYNAEIKQLNNCIRSVLYQSYPHWELCLADDCSTRDDIRPLLESWTGKDSRIKSVFLKQNSGISNATNKAASLATGDYVGLLDNDDELSLQALESIGKQINADGGDLFYSDEDLISTDARRYSIFRKPSFNQELLLNHNYITHFLLTKRSLYEKVGGCDSRYDGAQDLDLFLKLSEQAKTITHIPEILYHWRASASSTSINHSQKDYANKAGKMAIEAALRRRNITGSVSYSSLKFYYRVKRPIANQPTATLLVDFDSDQADPVGWLTRLTQLTDHPFDAIVVVCSNNAQLDALNSLAQDSIMKIDITVHLIEQAGLVHQFNTCSRDISTDFLIFISSKIDVQNSDWLESLIEYGQLDDIGMVGAKISCENETEELVTQIVDSKNLSASYYSRFLTNASALMNGRHCPQEVLSVNRELCLIKTTLFHKLHGFNGQSFPNLFAVHDLCYRLRKMGKRNIFTPYAKAFWQEPETVHPLAATEDLLEKEKRTFQDSYQAELRDGDPFYNIGIVGDAGESIEEFMAWIRGKHSSMS